MRSRAVLAAVVVLAVAPTAGARAAPAKKPCTPRSSQTVVKNRTARVFTLPGAAGDDTTERLYGCTYSKGKRVLLDESRDDLTLTDAFDDVRLNGRFVAWQHTSEDISCKADCPEGYDPTTITIYARDLRARRARAFDGAVSGSSLVVGANGTPAWLEDGASGQVDLRAGADVLDTGALAKLKLRGTTLSWTNFGQPKSAEFDVPPPTRAQRRRCALSGSKTVVQNDHGRVFTKAGAGDQGAEVNNRLFGCLYSRGKRTLLDVAYEDELGTSAGSFSQVHLNGRFVAWQSDFYDASCKAGCPPDYNPQHYNLRVEDLSTPNAGGRGISDHKADDGTLAGTDTGAIAWLEGGVARAWDADGYRQLDPGPVDAGSFRLSGQTLSWTTGGQPKTATLR
jgi:hypothetical protein